MRDRTETILDRLLAAEEPQRESEQGEPSELDLMRNSLGVAPTRPRGVEGIFAKHAEQ